MARGAGTLPRSLTPCWVEFFNISHPQLPFSAPGRGGNHCGWEGVGPRARASPPPSRLPRPAFRHRRRGGAALPATTRTGQGCCQPGSHFRRAHICSASSPSRSESPFHVLCPFPRTAPGREHPGLCLAVSGECCPLPHPAGPWSACDQDSHPVRVRAKLAHAQY